MTTPPVTSRSGHPRGLGRGRRVAKWAGFVFCILMVAAWAGSLRWDVEIVRGAKVRRAQTHLGAALCRGCIAFVNETSGDEDQKWWAFPSRASWRFHAEDPAILGPRWLP